jgi:predicted porin
MKKATLAIAVLAASTPAAWAQSSVTLYGIVDAAVRYTTNANAGQSQKQLVPGGMSQSRLGVNITEDMGGGLKALANMEHRLNSDTGAVAAADFWRQVWVGLQSSDLGQIRLGRQYNILFDSYTSTFASFRYSPYIEAYKPELGMALGARQSNMVKYLADAGGLRVELQVSAGEGVAGAPDKAVGGLLRYATGPFAVSGAYLQTQEAGGGKVKELLVGASYTDGPWYLHAAYADNKFDSSVTAVTRGTYTAGLAPANVTLSTASANVSKRSMLMAGVTYQMTAQFNVGATYWHVNQDPLLGSTDSKANYYAAVADYAFSKRTDAYLEVDLTKFNGNLAFANGAQKRGGAMVGVRHRF